MIIDQDINPKNSLYYLGSQVINLLSNSSDNEFDILSLYKELKMKITFHLIFIFMF